MNENANMVATSWAAASGTWRSPKRCFLNGILRCSMRICRGGALGDSGDAATDHSSIGETPSSLVGAAVEPGQGLIDSSDAICGTSVDIMWLIGTN
jgi:hypothetical protein